MSTLITEYLTLQQKYEQQYGASTIVLYQKGTFYSCWTYNELYCHTEEDKIDKDGKTWTGKIGRAEEISIILECALTQDNTNVPYSIRNVHMMGFPCIAYDKKLKVLLANNYVVIRMDEKTDTKNQYARYDRYVADIVSPSMTFDKLSTTQCHAYIVTIYIEYLKSKNLNYYDGYAVVSGIAVLDLVTGDTKVTEFYSKDNNEYHCLQEVYRYLTSLRPKEVIIHIDDMPKELSEDASLNPFSKHLEKVLECKRYDRYNVLINKVNAEYKKINYQTDFFNKLYNTTDLKNK